MIISVSLPVELFNKVRCREEQLLWELFKSAQEERLNGLYELQELGLFKAQHNTDQIYLNLLPHPTYFTSALSDSSSLSQTCKRTEENWRPLNHTFKNRFIF